VLRVVGGGNVADWRARLRLRLRLRLLLVSRSVFPEMPQFQQPHPLWLVVGTYTGGVAWNAMVPHSVPVEAGMKDRQQTGFKMEN
jgi:siroheme synthase (precorrin-2 oxidase/ferrochelatase)